MTYALVLLGGAIYGAFTWHLCLRTYKVLAWQERDRAVRAGAGEYYINSVTFEKRFRYRRLD